MARFGAAWMPELPALALPQTPMAAPALAPATARETLRCLYCRLVQFPTRDRTCRRCQLSLDAVEQPPPTPEPAPAPATWADPARHLAIAIRTQRLRLGLSQKECATRMSVPRTYVSKIENERATPTLGNLEKIARALETTITDLLSDRERSRQQEVDDLMQDQFIKQVAEYLPQLSEPARRALLVQTAALAAKSRETVLR